MSGIELTGGLAIAALVIERAFSLARAAMARRNGNGVEQRLKRIEQDIRDLREWRHGIAGGLPAIETLVQVLRQEVAAERVTRQADIQALHEELQRERRAELQALRDELRDRGGRGER